MGSTFLEGFRWETFDDPSGGYVNYVDQPTALKNNLTYGESHIYSFPLSRTN